MERRVPVLLRGRSRIRHFAKKCFHRLKAGATTSDGANCHDLLCTSLTALRTSADAFPPLKGVVGAVTSVLEISQRVTHSKKDAEELARHAVTILEMLADVIGESHSTSIPGPMLASIRRFQGTLEEIQETMNRLGNHSRIWRLTHLNRNEGALRKFHKRLDDAFQEFTIGSAIRSEACTYAVQTQLTTASAISITFHKEQVTLLRGGILLHALFFLAIPRLATPATDTRAGGSQRCPAHFDEMGLSILRLTGSCLISTVFGASNEPQLCKAWQSGGGEDAFARGYSL
ncbi:hypothetical protein B0H17DRAFT_1333306 [Mycena rosella]|uniref:Uncharacterized protein n=1 Tax=Mycena rosella TaxID=1033263 RepID=A0AAD7D7U0_MYCRO|nr:hypothetical protein B0H17DRAFT_1333306 [Mycena rosella]